MINVSTEFKNSIKELSVFSDGKADIVNSNGTLNFTSKELTSIEIYGSAFNNDKVLGNLAQHSLTLQLLGDLTKSISLNDQNIVKPYIGILVGTEYEYVQYQDFLITSISYSDTNNVTKIIATDNIVKLNKEFIDTNVYPMTLKSYLESVLTYCGLSLENTSFFNDDFVIESKPFSDYTLSSYIVGKISELALCFTVVNKSTNKIELKKAFDPFTRGYTHDELSVFTHEQLSNFTHFDIQHAIGLQDENVYKNNYWSFKLSDHWFGKFGINTLTLKVSQVSGESNSVQNDSYVSADGVVELTISDNELINTEALRLSVIDNMFNEVSNYKYNPYNLEYRGFPYLELGDIVQITNMDDLPFNSPIYEMTIRYDGGLYGKIEAKVLSKTEKTYLNTQTLSKRVKTAEIIVDKVQGEVTIMAGDYYNGKLEGAKYVFDGDNATFYGGGLKIKNNALEDVLYADVNGNLTLTGTIKQYKDSVMRVELDEDSLKFMTETGNIIGYLNGFNNVTIKSFIISTGTTYGDGSRIRFDEYPSGSNDTRIESINGSTVSELRIHAGTDIYPSSYLSSVLYVSSNVFDNGMCNAGASQSFIGNIEFNTVTFSQTESFIRTFSNGQIWLDSSTEQYLIRIGGSQRTIYRDANGFLKC